MKILHFHPSNNFQLAQYVSLLAKGMHDDVESAATDNAKEFGYLCSSFCPDIVHVHGQLPEKPIPQTARLVVTPHGSIISSPNAYVLIARSEIEKDQLSSYNPRIEVVRNPIITRSTNPERLFQQMTVIYRKVMDSNVLPLMDSDTTKTLSLLLKVGICGDQRWVDAKQITNPDWRKLFIYAELEGVSDVLRKGIALMNLKVPDIDAATIPTYLPADFKKPKPLGLCTFIDLIRQIEDEIANNQLSMLRLVEMHKALLRPDLDEEVLLKELEGEKLQSLLASLLQLLQETTMLDEGFMPCQPADDQLTERLRNLLKKHLQI